MDETGGRTRRVVAVALLAVAILLGLYIATGGSLPSPSSSPSTTSPPTAPPPLTAAPTGAIHGRIAVKATHLSGTLWRFAYTITNTGKVPIAGLQISGNPSNLTDISGLPGWNFYGAGVCHTSTPGILIYWSTGAASSTVIAPHGHATLSFQTRTTGTVKDQYAMSWDDATAQFGSILAPAPSTLKVKGQHCT